jgi:NADPH:quinone reductase-like Zn-dependent oxidoreductase
MQASQLTGIKALQGLLMAILFIFSIAGQAAESRTTRQYQLAKKDDGAGYQLVMKTISLPALNAGEVLLKVHAASLNRRDIYALYGSPRGDTSGAPILSDGAGEVVALGEGVSRFKVGDRVVGTFDVKWIDGASQGYLPRNGMLSEMTVATADTLLPIPDYLSYEEAASLPCAAVTAWNALFKSASLQAGEYVLLEGTGGVSVFGLQLAVAAEAQPIITSSSDAKLELARKLGAMGTVNYRTHPEWQHGVLEITGGQGVKHVLEVGGKDTLPRAIASLDDGGHIALIGGLSEGGFVRETPEEALARKNATLTNIYVGSRTDFENLLNFMEQHRIKPVIDRVFAFEDAPAAFDYMENESFFGKLVIRM